MFLTAFSTARGARAPEPVGVAVPSPNRPTGCICAGSHRHPMPSGQECAGRTAGHPDVAGAVEGGAAPVAEGRAREGVGPAVRAYLRLLHRFLPSGSSAHTIPP